MKLQDLLTQPHPQQEIIDLTGEVFTTDNAKNLVRHLANNSMVGYLNLANCRLGNDGLREIASLNCPNLHTINISANNITAEGVPYLSELSANNPALRRINIGGNSLGDDGAAQLAIFLLSNTQVFYLDLWMTGITKNGMRSLVPALTRSKVLREISLAGNSGIGDDGVTILADCLTKNTTLLELDLRGIPFSVIGLDRLLLALNTNNKLQKIQVLSPRLTTAHVDTLNQKMVIRRDNEAAKRFKSAYATSELVSISNMTTDLAAVVTDRNTFLEMVQQQVQLQGLQLQQESNESMTKILIGLEQQLHVIEQKTGEQIAAIAGQLDALKTVFNTVERIDANQQQQLDMLTEQQKVLVEQYQQEAQKLAEQKYLYETETLRQFYRNLQNKLLQFFLGCKVANSGLVTIEAYTTLEKTVKYMMLAGESIPLPGSDLIAKTLLIGFKLTLQAVNMGVEHREEKHIAGSAALITSLQELDDVSEKIARSLAQIYENQIVKLTAKGAYLLAEYALKLIIASIWAGEVNPHLDLVNQFIQTVASIKTEKQQQSFITKVISACKETAEKFATNKPIETKDEAAAWTAQGIFQRSGIMEGECLFAGGDTKPEKYGYRLGTQEEAFAAGLVEVQLSALRTVREHIRMNPADRFALGKAMQRAEHADQQTQLLQRQQDLLRKQYEAQQAEMERLRASYTSRTKLFSELLTSVNQHKFPQQVETHIVRDEKKKKKSF